MKSGKISDTALGRSILKEVQKVNPEGFCPRVGAGAAVVANEPDATKADAMVSAMQTVIGEGLNTAYLAAVRCANSLAAKGARPTQASLAITIPAEMDERDLRRMQERFCAYMKSMEVTILGGHTAVSRAVTDIVVSVQMSGETSFGKANTSPSSLAESEESPFFGLDVVMTKYCGLGGTALLAGHFTELLKERYPQRFIDRAAELLPELTKNEEALIALQNGAVYAHAAAEGGVFGALWELAEYAQCGLDIDLRRIPILQETVEICEVFDINPYQLRTEGVFLFLTEHGERLCEELAAAQIPASVIGKTVGGLDRAIRNEEEVRYLEPNRVEEYERIREKKDLK